jgi:hypothetical protein
VPSPPGATRTASARRQSHDERENDEGAARQQLLSSTQDIDTAKDTRRKASTPQINVVAKCDLITARSGRQSWHLTWRCSCGEKHRSVCRVLADELVRHSACGLLVLVHVDAAKQVAA